MKIIINNTISEKTYTDLKNVNFSPQIDLMGVQSYADTFEVDIYTEDTIKAGWRALLKDDFDYMYADFSITSVEIRDGQMVHIVAQSDLVKLNRKKLPARMYEGTEAIYICNGIVSGTGVIVSMSGSIAHKTISGYFPKQTARERLEWITFVLQATMNTSYDHGLFIEALDTKERLIPLEKTFYRPSIKYGDYVTAVQITSYSIVQSKQDGDEEVKDQDGIIYYLRPNTVSLSNTNVPANVPENIVSISGITIVSPSMASELLTTMAKFNFNRMSVEVDVVNNKQEFLPNRLYKVVIDDDIVASGHCDSIQYKFGAQIRTTLNLVGVTSAQAQKLIVNYKSASSPPGTVSLAKKEYTFPSGYVYSIDAMWPDVTFGGNRYIFRPEKNRITGTMGEGTTTITILCYTALILHTKTGILEVISVDQMDEEYVTNVPSGKNPYTVLLIAPASGEVEWDDWDDATDPPEPTPTPTPEPEPEPTPEPTPTPTATPKITVSSQPTKTVYEQGETLNLSGLVIMETKADGTTENVTNKCTFAPANGTTLSQSGRQSVLVSYTNDKNALLTTSIVIMIATPVSGSTISEGQYYDNTDIAEIYAPNAVTIEKEAFAGSSIVEGAFPMATTIEEKGFYHCQKLESISLPSCTSIGGSAFEDCRRLSVVDFSECRTIGSSAFALCSSIENVDLPECRTLSEGAFFGCKKLSTVSIPECTTIGAGAFLNCKSLQTLYAPKCQSVGNMAFQDDSSLTSIYLPSCTYVGEDAFHNCVNASEIILPQCTTIGEGAFAYCYKLSNINLSNCTSIGEGAFAYCHKISNVDLPNCTSIGSRAFNAIRNSQLTLSLPKVEYLGDMAFENTNVESVDLPKCKLVNDAFRNCSNLTTVSMPECTYIPLYAFDGCSKLSSVYLLGSTMCSMGEKTGEGYLHMGFTHSPFDQNDSAYAKVYVPSSLYSQYITANGWWMISNCIIPV